MSRMIYIIRHAEPYQIQTKKTYLGQSDIPLGPNGFYQAIALSCRMRKRKLEAIFCSDLLRARQTASMIARYHNCKHECRKELREINLGRWEGLSFAEVKMKYPDLYTARGEDILDFRPPEGESFSDLRERVIPAFWNIVSNTAGDLAIIAHAGVNRVLLSFLQKHDPRSMFTIRQDYAQIYIVAQRAAGFRVRAGKSFQ